MSDDEIVKYIEYSLSCHQWAVILRDIPRLLVKIYFDSYEEAENYIQKFNSKDLNVIKAISKKKEL